MTQTEMECRGSIWAADMAFNAMTAIELECRFSWIEAALDLGYHDNMTISGFLWGETYDPIRGW